MIFRRSAARVIVAAARASPWMRPCPGSRYTHCSHWPRPRWRRQCCRLRARGALGAGDRAFARGRRRRLPRDADARARARDSHEPPGAAAGGVVVVHGLGVHPDWGLIGGLRTGLADAGYVTLSVQMPVLAATARRATTTLPTLPEAARADRRRGGVSAGQGRDEDRDRFAQPRRVDGQCLSGATRRAGDRRVGAGRHVRRVRGGAEGAGARRRRRNGKSRRSARRRPRGYRRCRRTAARARSRSPAPTIISRTGRRSSSRRSRPSSAAHSAGC